MPELSSSDIHKYLLNGVPLRISQGDYVLGINQSLNFNDFKQPILEAFWNEKTAMVYQIEALQQLEGFGFKANTPKTEA